MEFSREKFKSIRLSGGIKSSEIASFLGVSRGTVSHWESGKNSPSKSLLPKIAEALGCNVDDFTSSEDDIINQIRAVLRDADGRIKHETRFDSAGNPYREHWNLELTPALWKRMEKCMEQSGYVGNEVDAYLQSLIAEDYRKRFLIQTPENQLTEDSGKAN